MNIKEKAIGFAANRAVDYISSNPEKNLLKLLDWMESVANEGFASQAKAMREALNDPDNIWYQYIMDLWNDIDNDVLKATFRNFGVNANVIGFPRQRKLEEKEDCNVPWAMLIDPTSACNLKCTGCWASEYGDSLNMPYETLDDIIRQGKEMGTYFYLYSGGEPLVRKRDIIRLCEAHPDCQFTAFTNGTLIDEEFADNMLRVKNFIPAISCIR